MAYSRDLPKMARQQCGIMDWHCSDTIMDFHGLLWGGSWPALMTGMDDWYGWMGWMTGMDDWHWWLTWMTGMDDWDGWLGWMTGMDDWHGWLAWMTGMDDWDGWLEWMTGMDDWFSCFSWKHRHLLLQLLSHSIFFMNIVDS